VASPCTSLASFCSDPGKPRRLREDNACDGFEIVGLCKNPLALTRFINLVIETTGSLCFDNASDEAGE